MLYNYTTVVIVVFTVGVALIRGNNFDLGNSLTDYSHVYASNRTGHSGIMVRCMTGLGPTDNYNGVLGGFYFNGNRMAHWERCADSQDIILSEPGTRKAGVINTHQCRQFATAVEGVYRCKMLNSAMLNESIRFGIYFSGRSK